ncbi:hypothetical protein F5Y16DRAFT_418366 [Xylariaceae sp. FL0255]|nr:hypothetical protein F5Y16DRAFT_418366 [Xylariaceae sp. FL0255]
MAVYECANCGHEPNDKQDKYLSRCASCRIEFYCDKKCQREHWPAHKPDCKNPNWRMKYRYKGEKREKEKKRRRAEQHERDIKIVETTGETRTAFNTRIYLQPPADPTPGSFHRRARKRRGKPIAYRHPIIKGKRVLRLKADKNLLDPSKFVDRIAQIEFASRSPLTDSEIEIIANADPKFRSGIRVFIAGDAQLKKDSVALEVTNASVKRLCQACPSLQVLKLRSTLNLGTRASPKIILNCPDIESITITAKRGSKTELTEFLNELIDKDYRTKLKFCEFRGVKLDPDHVNFLGFLTKVPKQKPQAEAGESEWEDESDDEARKKRLENSRAVKRAGQISAMRDILGREPFEGEEPEDFFGDLGLALEDPDSDGIDDEEHRQIMSVMHQLKDLDLYGEEDMRDLW